MLALTRANILKFAHMSLLSWLRPTWIPDEDYIQTLVKIT